MKRTVREQSQDYLRELSDKTGVVLKIVTPTSVLKAAFAAKLIEKGEIWMQALDARNKMSHTYSSKAFDIVLADIEKFYFHILENMLLKMSKIAAEEKKRHD